ncbi:MAG: ABC transporter substrate-binding protein [Stenotrophomonas maltophilia]
MATLGPGLAYSRLLRLRTGPLVEQPSLMLECDLCESWRLTSDFAYEFQLRPDVRWQNLNPVDGRPLVAGDLVYSYQRMETEGWPNAQLFTDRGISGFQAPEPGILRVSRAFLDSDALLALADGHSKIIAKEIVEQYGDLKRSPVVGTGPWIWESTEEGVGTALSRNPDYFEESLPYLDELVIKLVKPSTPAPSSAAKQIAAFRAGQVDVVNLPPGEWNLLSSSSAEFNASIAEQAGSGLLLWANLQTTLGGQADIRRAIFQAIDPWEYVHSLWEGHGSVGAGVPVPSPDWLLPQDTIRDNYFASPSEARELLAGTGVALPLSIEIAVVDSSQTYLDLGKGIAEDLRAVGFDPNLRAINPAHYNQLLLQEKESFELIIGSAPQTPTTNGFLLGLLHSRGPVNLLGHQDPLLDSLIEQQASERDPALRRRQLVDLQAYLLDQAYLFSPGSRTSRWAFDWDLKGFHPNTALSEYIFWSRAWLER